MTSAKFLKTPGHFWLGVFVCGILVTAWSGVALAAQGQLAGCPAQSDVQWATLSKVIDGDTLRLTDGRKIRLIAVNAPELASGQQAAQPLARRAKKAVEQFFKADQRVALQPGEESKDKYGRVLAYVFNSAGESLAARLLSQGLVWHIVVPPNAGYVDCLAAMEQAAREQQLGVWHGTYPPLDAARLRLTDTGFQRIRGQLLAVERSSDGWWLQLGELAVRLSENDLHYFGQKNFDQLNPEGWLGKTVIIRGWVIDRSQRQTPEQQRRFSALMVQLRHPAMIEFDEPWH